MHLYLLGWWVLGLTDSAFKVALVGFCITLPLFILGPFGGLLADSKRRKLILKLTQILSLAAAVTMAVCLNIIELPYWYAYPVASAVGTAWALDRPTRQSIMLDLHGRVGVVNALALESAAQNTARMAGPAFAGLLILFAGVDGGYIAVVVIAAISTAVFLVLDLKLKPRESISEQRSVWRNLVDGIAYIKSEKTILAVVLITIAVNLFHFPYQVLMPVIARDVLNVGAGKMGALTATEGFAALIGAILVAGFALRIRHHGWVLAGGATLSLSMLVLFSFSSWFSLSLPIMLVMGLGASGFSAMQASIVMLVARADVRGRALGIITLAVGTGPFGALLLGSLADMMTPSFALRLNALLGLGLIALIWIFLPGIRQRLQNADPPDARPK